MRGEARRTTRSAAVVVAALGVVFGDIGTSPIYRVQTAFNPTTPHPVQASMEAVYGLASLIFWAVTLIVTVKYVLLVMNADDDGEGGTMALISQIRKLGGDVSARRKFLLAGLGVFGAALFFGDSMVTPAISVLSAVEGMETIEPSLDTFVVPITVTIVILLFVLQRLGSGAVGRLFAPVMLVWFLTIAALGIRGVAMHPAVLEALSPTYAFDFLFHNGWTGFFALTAVVLAITGVEALYADLGHFGRPAITRAWLLLVFPACILSYLGQGGLILDDPGAIGAPFFELMPHAGLIPLVILATAATVIASQAVISGAFSLAHQGTQLGYLPRLGVVHTSEREYGQVYAPVVNWLLMAAVLALVITFQSSEKLAFAYGTAVTGTIITTTVLFFVVARHRWHRPLWLVVSAAAFFTFVTNLRTHDPPVETVPGTGVFMSRGRQTVPLSMRACVDHLHALPEHAIILSTENLPTPRIRPAHRLAIDDLLYRDDGITFVRAKYGYAEHYDVPALVTQIANSGIESPPDTRDISFYLSRIELRAGDRRGMRRWRKQLYLATTRLAGEQADYFRLPRERTITLGSVIEF